MLIIIKMSQSIRNKIATRIIKTTSLNPFFNSAVEELTFRKHPTNIATLYLWRNSPNVVIGCHQNAYKECDLTKMHADNITLVRRKSGGGTVYQDFGNAIFSFISPYPIDEA